MSVDEMAKADLMDGTKLHGQSCIEDDRAGSEFTGYSLSAVVRLEISVHAVWDPHAVFGSDEYHPPC